MTKMGKWIILGISLAVILSMLLLRSVGTTNDKEEVVSVVPSEVRGVPYGRDGVERISAPRTIRVTSSGPLTIMAPETVIPVVSHKPSVESQLRLVANRFKINTDQFVAVARCESGLRSDAVGDHGSSVGVLQFKAATFEANALRYFGYSVGDMRRDVMASAVVAAWMIQRGQYYQWTCARTLGFA